MKNDKLIAAALIRNILKESTEGDLYSKVLEFTKSRDTISVSAIQRQFRIGYSEAANYLQTLERSKIISPGQPSGARDVLVKESIDFNRISRKIIRNLVQESFAMGSYGYGEEDVYGKWESVDRDLRSLGWVRQKSKSELGDECMLTEPVWINPKLILGRITKGDLKHPMIMTKMLKNLKGATWVSFIFFDDYGGFDTAISYKDKIIAEPSTDKVTVQGHPTLEKSLEALMNSTFKDDMSGQTYKVRYWLEKWSKTTGDSEPRPMPRVNAGIAQGRRSIDAGKPSGGSWGLGTKMANWFK